MPPGPTGSGSPAATTGRSSTPAPTHSGPTGDHHQPDLRHAGELYAHGFAEAWGMYAYPSGQYNATAAPIINSCFAYACVDGGSLNTGPAIPAPYSIRAESLDGGNCNLTGLACSTVFKRNYDSPAIVRARLSPGANQWGLVQFYHLVTGSRPRNGTAPAWDCTNPDWRYHWSTLPSTTAPTTSSTPSRPPRPAGAPTSARPRPRRSPSPGVAATPILPEASFRCVGVGLAGSGSMATLADDLVSDELWALVEPLLSAALWRAAPNHLGSGLPGRDGVHGPDLHPWRLLPAQELGCGSPATGASLDTMSVRARRGGPGGRKSSRPWPAPGRRGDIPPVRTPAGRRRTRPAAVHADKGYDSRTNRALLRRQGIKSRIARRQIEPSTRLGRHRRKVERALSWLRCFRWLQVRWDRDAGRWFAFVLVACAVCFNRR